MSTPLHGPRPKLPGATASSGEVLRIAASMTATCAAGALILGGVYLGTERYATAAGLRAERAAVMEMLGIDSTATITEVRQFLLPDGASVLYRTGEGDHARDLVFALDGTLLRSGPPDPAATAKEDALEPLGRLFVARHGADPLGFVVEEEARGYKNRIRFFVALSGTFDVAGVRVLEHEEDPGLGAEVATSWFQGQFVGRPAAGLSTLDVTRDPMPEDWRRALAERVRLSPAAWRAQNEALLARERGRPIYAVTGATISSRALTDGVRTAVDHFRRRWELLAPHLESPS